MEQKSISIDITVKKGIIHLFSPQASSVVLSFLVLCKEVFLICVHEIKKKKVEKKKGEKWNTKSPSSLCVGLINWLDEI